jgi:hypothetical protein
MLWLKLGTEGLAPALTERSELREVMFSESYSRIWRIAIRKNGCGFVLLPRSGLEEDRGECDDLLHEGRAVHGLDGFLSRRRRERLERVSCLMQMKANRILLNASNDLRVS